MQCKPLTIFEGPDGAGKTTIAKAFAQETRARYVHFNALPLVQRSLGRVYVEAMLPALLGYQAVVFDRSWMSEVPYGMAFREGADRLGNASRCMLERLAMRCGAVLVRCDPGWEQVRDNFLKRKHLEMLDNDTQLRRVYDLYRSETSALLTVDYDYRTSTLEGLIEDAHVQQLTTHSVSLATAGNLEAKVVLVGEAFATPKDYDSFYQWPFGSFNSQGCSQWLTEQLYTAGISERDLLWVNADQNLDWLIGQNHVFALGEIASRVLTDKGIKHDRVAHPQFAKRFEHGKPYSLIAAIKEILK